MQQGSNSNQRLEVIVGGDEGFARLDRVLAVRCPALSRSRLKALILAGEVTIAGRTIRDPATSVKSGDLVKVALLPPEPATPQGHQIVADVPYAQRGEVATRPEAAEEKPDGT